MKLTLTICFQVSVGLLLCSNLMAQDYWSEWNKKYKPVDFCEVLAFEKSYADSISKMTDFSQTYCRVDKYRIIGKFKNEIRPVESETLHTMRNVLKFFAGSPNQLDELVFNEVLFEIDGNDHWLPIQQPLKTALFEEVLDGDYALLYCLFFNDRATDGIVRNIFLISEFQAFD